MMCHPFLRLASIGYYVSIEVYFVHDVTTIEARKQIHKISMVNLEEDFHPTISLKPVSEGDP